MLEVNKKFDVPLAYFYQKIEPELRKKLFKTIVTDMPKKFTNLKFLGAYLNWNMEDQYDYYMLFETTNTMNMPFVLYMLPVLGDRHSIQGFYYCVLQNKVNEFFEDTFLAMVPLEASNFIAILNTLNLSTNTQNPNFWRTPEKMPILGKHLLEITKVYKPQIKVEG